MNDLSHPPKNSSEPQPAGAGSQLPLWTPDDAATPANSSDNSRPAESSPPLPAPPWPLADLGLFVVFAVATFLFANAVVTGVFLVVRRVVGWNIRVEEILAQTPFLVLMQTLWEG